MFPESHSHAFAVTAYKAAWLKRHHPLEFFVALMNNQPMGFYPMETLKQDAKRFGVPFLNPCVNGSPAVCAPEGGSVRLGLQLIKDVGTESAKLIVEERERHGPYVTAGDLVRRTGLKPQAVLSLAMAGAFDGITHNRREALWEAGLHTRPSRNGQAAMPVPTDDGVPRLPDFTDREKMMGEYRVMGIYPKGHLMEFVRPGLGSNVVPTVEVETLGDDKWATVAGWPVARQHPRGRDGTVFLTIEDETGDVQVIVWRGLVRQAPQRARQPGGGGHGPGIEVGRDYERHCDGRARRSVGCNHASPPRLALTFIPVYRDCAGVVNRFIINARCAVDIA